jgi:hypothetical protein
VPGRVQLVHTLAELLGEVLEFVESGHVYPPPPATSPFAALRFPWPLTLERRSR